MDTPIELEKEGITMEEEEEKKVPAAFQPLMPAIVKPRETLFEDEEDEPKKPVSTAKRAPRQPVPIEDFDEDEDEEGPPDASDSDYVESGSDSEDGGRRRRKPASASGARKSTRISARKAKKVEEEKVVVETKRSSRPTRAVARRTAYKEVDSDFEESDERPSARRSSGRKRKPLYESLFDEDDEEDTGPEDGEDEGRGRGGRRADVDTPPDPPGARRSGRANKGVSTDLYNISHEAVGRKSYGEDEEGIPRSRSNKKARPSTTGGKSRSRARSESEGAGDEVLSPEKKRGRREGTEEEGGAAGGARRARALRPEDVEKCLDVREDDDAGLVKSVLVKYRARSYREVQWLPYARVFEAKRALLTNLEKRLQDPDYLYKMNSEFPHYRNGYDPAFCEVDRIINERRDARGRVSYLVKWCELGYAESTWEFEEDLTNDEDLKALEQFRAREGWKGVPSYVQAPAAAVQEVAMASQRHKKEVVERLVGEGFEPPAFKNDRKLRDYQLVSLKWMLTNWLQLRSCILGDEMGLGKTAQSIAVLEALRTRFATEGPFLIVAPLTTLGHWRREIETWTDMNCVVYTGNAADRETIVQTEIFKKEFTTVGRGRAASRVYNVKFNVLLATYETLNKEIAFFQQFMFSAVIADEAHRLKGINTSVRQAFASLRSHWRMLLSGTPIQNNTRELFSMLNLLDPPQFPSEDAFEEEFGGDTPTAEQVFQLQTRLQPYLLRRMKEDVESLPEKEEVIVWVDLTVEQRIYYKAMYEDQIGALMTGADRRNLPNLTNLAMELRKLCNHLFLCNGLEEEFKKRRYGDRFGALGPHHMQLPDREELESLIQGSAKMVLLHKLLQKLRSEGRKVLIFSQFKIMLDLIEAYLKISKLPVERVDGSVRGPARQAAIDRFQRGEQDAFCFLLSTKAGGQGITLTAADTAIIYDSDWNPQNDLQAMARCHRIGQTQEVTVYRLLCRDTYEETLFQTASKKYGLDEAILGGVGKGGPSTAPGDAINPEQDAQRIVALLKHGVHNLASAPVPAEGAAGGADDEDIENILKSKTEKRQIGSRAGNTFSTATFAVDETRFEGASEKDYWAKLFPDAAARLKQQEEEEERIKWEGLGKRTRERPDYNEANMLKNVEGKANGGGGRKGRRGESDSEPDAGGIDDGSSGDEEGAFSLTGGRARAKHNAGEWTVSELTAFLDALLSLGEGRAAQCIMDACGLPAWGGEGEGDVSAGAKLFLGKCATYGDAVRAERAILALMERAATLHPIVAEKVRRKKLEDRSQTGAPAAGARPREDKWAAFLDEPLLDATHRDTTPDALRKTLQNPGIQERFLKTAPTWLAALKERRCLARLMKHIPDCRTAAAAAAGAGAGKEGAEAAAVGELPESTPILEAARLLAPHVPGWSVPSRDAEGRSIKGRDPEMEGFKVPEKAYAGKNDKGPAAWWTMDDDKRALLSLYVNGYNFESRTDRSLVRAVTVGPWGFAHKIRNHRNVTLRSHVVNYELQCKDAAAQGKPPPPKPKELEDQEQLHAQAEGPLVLPAGSNEAKGLAKDLAARLKLLMKLIVDADPETRAGVEAQARAVQAAQHQQALLYQQRLQLQHAYHAQIIAQAQAKAVPQPQPQLQQTQGGGVPAAAAAPAPARVSPAAGAAKRSREEAEAEVVVVGEEAKVKVKEAKKEAPPAPQGPPKNAFAVLMGARQNK